MRKFLIPIAAAASTIAVAAPASAQYYPQPQPQPQQVYGYGYQQPQGYGYGYQYPQPQNYGYGHHNPYQQQYGYQANYGQVRAVKQRIDRIQHNLRHLAQYRMISSHEYQHLSRESRDIERRFFRNSRDGYGLTPREMYDVQVRITRLEQRIARDTRDGRQWRHRW